MRLQAKPAWDSSWHRAKPSPKSSPSWACPELIPNKAERSPKPRAELRAPRTAFELRRAEPESNTEPKCQPRSRIKPSRFLSIELCSSRSETWAVPIRSLSQAKLSFKLSRVEPRVTIRAMCPDSIVEPQAKSSRTRAKPSRVEPSFKSLTESSPEYRPWRQTQRITAEPLALSHDEPSEPQIHPQWAKPESRASSRALAPSRE